MESNLTIFDLGQVANRIAAEEVFSDYRSRRAANTLSRQDVDLDLFGSYLAEKGIPAGDLALGDSWETVTWGLVSGFVRWLLREGYAIGTVNLRLSTVKTYSQLAYQAGKLSHDEYLRIRGLRGYSAKETSNVDTQRKAEGVSVRKAEIQVRVRTKAGAKVVTRQGGKKASPVFLAPAQAKALRACPDLTAPQGLRDALLIGLMLDLGLRVGEAVLLEVKNFDLEAGTIMVFRPKVKRTQTLKMSQYLRRVASQYLPAIGSGKALRGSRRGGKLAYEGMSEQAATQRVQDLGEQIGVHGLSCHDLRHTWATRQARNRVPVDRLMEAGGWATPSMALRYLEAARIANEGCDLGDE